MVNDFQINFNSAAESRTEEENDKRETILKKDMKRKSAEKAIENGIRKLSASENRLQEQSKMKTVEDEFQQQICVQAGKHTI